MTGRGGARCGEQAEVAGGLMQGGGHPVGAPVSGRAARTVSYVAGSVPEVELSRGGGGVDGCALAGDDLEADAVCSHVMDDVGLVAQGFEADCQLGRSSCLPEASTSYLASARSRRRGVHHAAGLRSGVLSAFDTRI